MRTKIFSGFGKRGRWKAATGLEVFRFAIYIVTPIAASVAYSDPKVMHWLIMKSKFVHYPESSVEDQERK